MNRILILAAAMITVTAHADLGVGDKAPDLKVANVVKGKQVDLKKGVHVVEFWATWCVPCRQTIPHLTEMAKKYKGKAEFTGVSVFESGADQLGQVKTFVKEMGDQMNYNISFDGQEQFMGMNWMKAAKQSGIPTSFLIKDGTILWIGHPMDGLDGLVGKAISGELDLTLAKKMADEQRTKDEKMASKQKEIRAKLRSFGEAMGKNDYKAALAELEKVQDDKALPPDLVPNQRYNLYLLLDDPRMNETAVLLSEGPAKSIAPQLNQIAWQMVDPAKTYKNADYKVALEIVKKSIALAPDDANSMDTLAVAYFRAGDKENAIKTCKAAMELARKAKMANLIKECEARLVWFNK